MKKLISLLTGVSLFAACATTHPGRTGRPVKQGPDMDLHLSVALNRDYSDATNFYYDITMENKSGTYLRIDQVELDFSNEGNIPHNVVVGQDLVAWAESYAIRKEKENYNGDLGTAALVLTGAALVIAGAATGRSDESRALLQGGTVLAGVGVGWDAYRKIKNAKDQVMRAKWVPESHLYSPVTVPSSGFAQRWVIVNLPKKSLARTALLKIRTIEGHEGIYEIDLAGGNR